MDLKTLHDQRRASQAQAQSVNQSRKLAQAAATSQMLFPLIDQLAEITRQRQELLKQSHADEAPEILLSTHELAEKAVIDYWESRVDGFGSLSRETVGRMGMLSHDFVSLISSSSLEDPLKNGARMDSRCWFAKSQPSGLILAGEDHVQSIMQAVSSGSPDQVRQAMRQAVEVWSQKEVDWVPAKPQPWPRSRW